MRVANLRTLRGVEVAKLETSWGVWGGKLERLTNVYILYIHIHIHIYIYTYVCVFIYIYICIFMFNFSSIGCLLINVSFSNLAIAGKTSVNLNRSYAAKSCGPTAHIRGPKHISPHGNSDLYLLILGAANAKANI